MTLTKTRTLNSPLLVANSILHRAYYEKRPITHLKLQKLIYFVYKHYLKNTREPLFDEHFEVWTHGPVLRSVYDVFKNYGSDFIESYAYTNGDIARIISKDHTNFYNTLEWVWEHYHNYSPFTLRDLTHRDGTAWQKSKDANELYIKDSLIIEEEWYA